jgi:murein peptide amidase A
MSRYVFNRSGARSLLGATLAAVVLLSTVGCISEIPRIRRSRLPRPGGQAGALPPATRPGQVSQTTQPSPLEPQCRTIGYSVEGRPIECIVLGRGADVILLLATTHGNEGAGTPLLRRLADHLVEHSSLLAGRQVVLVPVVNPDGFARHVRYNARGVDLNRNFPSGNWIGDVHSGRAPLSEPETQAIHDLLDEYRPSRITTIHEGLRCVDFDGPAEPMAQIMSQCCDLPLRQLGGRCGSLGSYAGVALGRPIVTVELARNANRLDENELWSRYCEMLLAGIEFGGNALARASEGN